MEIVSQCVASFAILFILLMSLQDKQTENTFRTSTDLILSYLMWHI